MRFEEAYGGWEAGRLGVCERTFRRYLMRYEADGMEGLVDRRLEQVSHRKAPVDEVMDLLSTYRRRHEGWSAKHFYAWYRKDSGTRSYTRVKSRLQEEELVPKAKARGGHRKRRGRSPWPGLKIHQDGSRHEWVAGQPWDLTMWIASRCLHCARQEGRVSRIRRGAPQERRGAGHASCPGSPPDSVAVNSKPDGLPCRVSPAAPH